MIAIRRRSQVWHRYSEAVPCLKRKRPVPVLRAVFLRDPARILIRSLLRRRILRPGPHRPFQPIGLDPPRIPPPRRQPGLCRVVPSRPETCRGYATVLEPVRIMIKWSRHFPATNGSSLYGLCFSSRTNERLSPYRNPQSYYCRAYL